MATTADISKDVVIKFKDDLYVVTEFQKISPGKGSAFVRTKLKNIRTGKVLENTFKDGEAVEIVDVEKKRMQYLYKDAHGYTFMDNTNYEQVAMPEGVVGDKAAFLKEGLEVVVVAHESIPLNLELPKKVTFKVVEAAPGVKGNTASGNVTKEVTLENGTKIRTPLFIKEGDEVVINSESGEYVERA